MRKIRDVLVHRNGVIQTSRLDEPVASYVKKRSAASWESTGLEDEYQVLTVDADFCSTTVDVFGRFVDGLRNNLDQPLT